MRQAVPSYSRLTVRALSCFSVTSVTIRWKRLVACQWQRVVCCRLSSILGKRGTKEIRDRSGCRRDSWKIPLVDLCTREKSLCFHERLSPKNLTGIRFESFRADANFAFVPLSFIRGFVRTKRITLHR